MLKIVMRHFLEVHILEQIFRIEKKNKKTC